MSLEVFLLAVNEGLLWGLMALGVFITFRTLNFPDLTVEGSVVLGMAVAGRLIIAGVDPLIATLMAAVAGAGAGLITGFLHTVLKIPPLLSGILTMTGLWTINLRVTGDAGLLNIIRGTNHTLMSGNRALETVATNVAGWFGDDRLVRRADLFGIMIVGLIFVTIVIILLRLFFNTELGYAIRATGDNEPMVRAQGVNTNKMKVVGLMAGNACVALSGALIAQAHRTMNIQMGIGSIVIGLAAVIIGEVIFRDKNNYRVFVSVIIGSIIFWLIRAFVLGLHGMDANDFRLITAVMIALALSLPMLMTKVNSKFNSLITPRAPACGFLRVVGILHIVLAAVAIVTSIRFMSTIGNWVDYVDGSAAAWQWYYTFGVLSGFFTLFMGRQAVSLRNDIGKSRLLMWFVVIRAGLLAAIYGYAFAFGLFGGFGLLAWIILPIELFLAVLYLFGARRNFKAYVNHRLEEVADVSGGDE